MERIFGFVVGRPLVVIASVLAVTVAFALQLQHLSKDDSVDKMLPDGDPLLRYTHQIEEVFSSDEFLVVAVESPDPYSAATVAKLVRMTDDLESIRGVRGVMSPTNTKNLRGAAGMIFSEPLVNEKDPPQTREELVAYRRAIGDKDLFRGSIVSEDGRAFGFILRLESEPDKQAIVGAVGEITKKHRGPEEIYFSGSPAINLQVGRYMGKDMGKFFPLVVVVIMTVFSVSFRSLWGTLLPLCSLAFTVLWTLGFMALVRVPISVIGTMIPALLIAIGSSYGIHVLHQYYEDVSVGQDRRRALIEALRHISPTILLAGFTTAAGFASLVLNDTRILREFGLFTAFGIVSAMILSLTFLPAGLALCPPPDANKKAALASGPLARLLGTVGRFNARHRTLVLGAVLVLVALALAGYHRLFLETNAVNFFAKDDVVRETIGRISTGFGGTIPIRIVVDAGQPGAILDPATLEQIEACQRYLEGFDRVGKTVSIADIIRDMNMALHEGDPAWNVLPDTLRGAEQLLFLYTLASEPNEFESLIDDSHSMATVIARLRQVDDNNVPLGTRGTKEILDQLQRFIDRTFDEGLKVTPTGRALNIVRTSEYIVRGLIQSMLTALLCIFILTALFFRSPAAGFFSILVVAVALVLNFGVMAWAGIPLDIATTLISSIAIGIGVDDSIHYLIRCRRIVREGEQDPVRAMTAAVHRAGQPLFTTSLALICGFSVLTVASFLPVVYFGGLTALTMVNTTVGALFLLPVLTTLIRPRFVFRHRG